ncbi:hypothetical protein J2752_001125 [Halarchaeum rubridurum]|uniref:Uncharacterized protein n=1 Tax=Halarchaeum rubridurum TaxID=489911 RepID=A0A830FY82_9EURY|nr:hypothetical protein [Halarchaeum rubridurum]MBP1954244.1 hypothetical protein [Halarchaeum rubridurum]GGM58471.1 hypothetical protein GCM10009017_05780 [Halarchaeum rubridurum]
MTRNRSVDAFADALAAFEGSDAERAAVARVAADLAASGRYERDAGHELTPAILVEHLGDAPEGRVASRWNWWVGSLDLAYGGYAEFVVRRWRA